MNTYTENILEAPESEYVCYCSKITKKQILKAITDGATTLQDIKRLTGACMEARCKVLNPRKR